LRAIPIKPPPRPARRRRESASRSAGARREGLRAARSAAQLRSRAYGRHESKPRIRALVAFRRTSPKAGRGRRAGTAGEEFVVFHHGRLTGRERPLACDGQWRFATVTTWTALQPDYFPKRPLGRWFEPRGRRRRWATRLERQKAQRFEMIRVRETSLAAGRYSSVRAVGAHQQVRRGLSGQALLRRAAEFIGHHRAAGDRTARRPLFGARARQRPSRNAGRGAAGPNTGRRTNGLLLQARAEERSMGLSLPHGGSSQPRP